MKNKKVFVGIIIAVIAVSLSLVIFNSIKVEKEREQKAIDEQSNQISDQMEAFNNESNHSTQYQELCDFLDEYDKYKQGDEVFDEVVNLYEENISSMKDTIKAYYDKTVQDNTLDANSVTDNTAFANINGALTQLITDITNEKDNILTAEEYESYKTAITNLTTSYQTRIDQIVAQQKAASQNSSANNNGSGDTSGSHSINSSHGSWTEKWLIDDNGNEIPGSRIRHYEDGCVVAPDGKFYTFEEWGAYTGVDVE